MSIENSRIIDANLNRLREGIRVIEDIARYEFNSFALASRLKSLRHEARIDCDFLLQSRDIQNDILKESTPSEQNRANLREIISANFKRAQESARVLEEILKLDSSEKSEKFKAIRYALYDAEVAYFAAFEAFESQGS